MHSLCCAVCVLADNRYAGQVKISNPRPGAMITPDLDVTCDLTIIDPSLGLEAFTSQHQRSLLCICIDHCQLWSLSPKCVDIFATTIPLRALPLGQHRMDVWLQTENGLRSSANDTMVLHVSSTKPDIQTLEVGPSGLLPGTDSSVSSAQAEQEERLEKEAWQSEEYNNGPSLLEWYQQRQQHQGQQQQQQQQRGIGDNDWVQELQLIIGIKVPTSRNFHIQFKRT